MDITTADNFQLKWHSYETHLHNSIAMLLQTELYSDVFLATVDGRQISAHRFILSACSSYLHQLLKLICPAANNFPIVIVLPSDISYITLKILVQYMYSGEATVSHDQLDGILRAAHILGVKGLCREKRSFANPVVPDKNGNTSLTDTGVYHRQLQTELLNKSQRRCSSRLESCDQLGTSKIGLIVDNHVHSTSQGNANKKDSQSKSNKYDENPIHSSTMNNAIINSGSCDYHDKTEQSFLAVNDDHMKSGANNVNETESGQSGNSAKSDPIQLIVKQETIEWVDSEMDEQGGDDSMPSQMHTEMTIKPVSHSFLLLWFLSFNKGKTFPE